MSEILEYHLQQQITQELCSAAENIRNNLQEVITEYLRPSVIYRPSLEIDGDHWCALYGKDIQCGVAGFGKSPKEAMYAFDVEWNKSLK
jgi:hypothetical protein